VRPLERDEYEKRVELGAFDDERVELLLGRIVERPPQGPPHDDTVTRSTRTLLRRLGDAADVRPQCAFLGPESVTIPDLAVIPAGDYSAAHPASAHLSVVEVSRDFLR
jgi:Uma2 family endonuclease